MNWERALSVGCANHAEQQEAWAEVERLRDKLSFAISEDGLDYSLAEFTERFEAAEAEEG